MPQGAPSAPRKGIEGLSDVSGRAKLEAGAEIMKEWQYHLVRERSIEGWGEGRRIKVTAGLHWLQGNQKPYFSVTANIYRPGESDIDACGCMHDEILKTWPDLAPVVAMHLSGPDGVPMHFEENGLYHLGIGKYSELNLQHAASHFRITETQAQKLRDRIMSGSGYDPDKYNTECASMLERFKAEAKLAIFVLTSGDSPV